jgi:hypothetical protein
MSEGSAWQLRQQIESTRETSVFAFLNFRVLIGLLALLAGSVLGAISFGVSLDAPAASSKIASWVMEHTANGQQAEFFVVLVDHADLSPPFTDCPDNTNGSVRPQPALRGEGAPK